MKMKQCPSIINVKAAVAPSPHRLPPVSRPTLPRTVEQTVAALVSRIETEALTPMTGDVEPPLASSRALLAMLIQ